MRYNFEEIMHSAIMFHSNRNACSFSLSFVYSVQQRAIHIFGAFLLFCFVSTESWLFKTKSNNEDVLIVDQTVDEREADKPTYHHHISK